MFDIFVKGSFKHTDRFLKKCLNVSYDDILDHYGKLGVEALKNATPIDSGETVSSWYYEIEKGDKDVTLRWCNSNVVGYNCNVAVLLQLGHATRNGGYVEGIDYINPALRPIFEDIANKAFEEVAKI